MIESIVISTLLFTSSVNAIRSSHGMEPIYFVHDKSVYEYVTQCEPIRQEGMWIILSAGHSTCGRNSAENRADMIYALDEQYPWMKSGLFERDRKTASAAVYPCNGKFMIAVK